MKLTNSISRHAMQIGGLVFLVCLGLIYMSSRKELSLWGTKQATLASAAMESYIDGRLRAVEDAGYSLASYIFYDSWRNADGTSKVLLHRSSHYMTEEELFHVLEQFLLTNPQVCGVAIGLQYPEESPYRIGKYGFACYVTTVGEEMKRLRLGDINDYRNKEWYKEARKSGKPYWSRPFRETCQGKIVACFSLPIYDADDYCIGVMAVDVNMDLFRQQCMRSAPFEGAEIALVDREQCIIAHSDTTLQMKYLSELEERSVVLKKIMDSLPENPADEDGLHVDIGDTVYHLTYVDLNGWTVCTKYNKKDMLGGSEAIWLRIFIFTAIFFLVMAVLMGLLSRKLQETAAKNASVESELNVAATIQMDMLKKPRRATKEEKLDMFVFIKPAKEVGGDLYDYAKKDGRLFFIIGDVSDKGVPASLFMAEVLALFRNNIQHTDSPARVAQTMNATLSLKNKHQMFCTAFLGLIDPIERKLVYCNVGHNPPVIDGSFLDVKPSLPLGIDEGAEYVDCEISLTDSSYILLYTDGITEARNQNREMFGQERLLQVCADGADLVRNDSSAFGQSILSSLASFTQEADQSDDITMMVIRVKPAED